MSKKKNQKKRNQTTPRERKLLALPVAEAQQAIPNLKRETRAPIDRDLHKRIGPAVPVQADDWY